RYNRDFDINSREVFIDGEAFFEVEKRKHPLVVHTSHFDIHVLGTSFNVKSYPEEDNIETTLVEGNIRIESDHYGQPLFLKPNQKLTYLKATNTIKSVDLKTDTLASSNEPENGTVDTSRKTDEIEIYEDVNVEEATSWKDGKLIINKEPLLFLARKLERKYNIEFEFENEDLKEYSYSGTLRDFPLEQVLKALELTSPINYTIDEKTVTLSHNENFKPRIRN
ncbi:MAG: FecR family protein, partial [Bacteroidales bacterium]